MLLAGDISPDAKVRHSVTSAAASLFQCDAFAPPGTLFRDFLRDFLRGFLQGIPQAPPFILYTPDGLTHLWAYNWTSIHGSRTAKHSLTD